MNVRFNTSNLYEKRKREVNEAKLSLVEEHEVRDEAIQMEIRKNYSLSQEVAILRKQVNELTSTLKAMLDEAEVFDDEAVVTEFEEYNKYIENCKKKVTQKYNELMDVNKEEA